MCRIEKAMFFIGCGFSRKQSKMKINLVAKTNSFLVNNVEHPKGSLCVTYNNDNTVTIGSWYNAKLVDITGDGATFATIAELKTYVSANLFKAGGGSGGGAVNSVTGSLVTGSSTDPVVNNPLLEFHRVIITDGGTRTITDFNGNIILVTNGIDPANTFTLNWDALTVETRKVTILCTFNATSITHVGINGAIVSRLPTSAKINDVWEVIYDKFYNTWAVVSTNLVGTNAQISGYVDGVKKPIAIGVEQLSDISGFPPFANGILAATAMNSVDKTGLLLFIEFSTTTPKVGTFPTYGTGGVLPVGNGVSSGDAVNKGQLDAAISAIPTIISRSYTATGSEDNEVTLSTGIIGFINPIIAVLPSNTDAILAILDSGWSYNSSNGNVTFNTGFLESGKTYTYTILIKQQ